MSTISGLSEQLQREGYKLTPARLAVIEVLETASGHLSHDQILKAGRKIYPGLSRATVYRTMDLLVELELMRPLYFNEPPQRFVSAVGGRHYLLCTCCHQTIEFDHDAVDRLVQDLSEMYDFQYDFCSDIK